MRDAIRNTVAVLAILAAVVYFFASAEEEGGVPLWDWLRDPAGSRDRHAEYMAGKEAQPLQAPQGARPPSEPARSAAAPDSTGRALRLDGTPAAGISVSAVLPERGTATTDESGRFALQLVAPDAQVRPATEGWILLASGRAAAGASSSELVLVVAECMSLRGRVTDETGQVLEDALLVGFTPLALAADETIPIELPARLERRTLSDAEGSFELVDLPRLPFLRIDTSKPGYRSKRSPPPEDPTAEMEIVLQSAGEDEGGGF